MSWLEKLWRRHSPGLPMFTLNRLSISWRHHNEAWIRSLCYDVAIDECTSICRVLGRFKMFVDSSDYSVSVHLMFDGYWEMWLTEAIASVARNGMVAIDIGANLGYFSLVMADLVGADGHVHAFEANQEMADRARKSAALNAFGNRITVHAQAVGDADGVAYALVVPDGQPGGAYLVPEDHLPGDQSGASVAMRRLDSYPELLDADIVKIDVEGAEEAVWRGMEGLLARGRPMTIFLEFASVRYADPGAFLDDIARWGFRIDLLDVARGIVPVSRDWIIAAPPGQDLLLVLQR